MTLWPHNFSNRCDIQADFTGRKWKLASTNRQRKICSFLEYGKFFPPVFFFFSTWRYLILGQAIKSLVVRTWVFFVCFIGLIFLFCCCFSVEQLIYFYTDQIIFWYYYYCKQKVFNSSLCIQNVKIVAKSEKRSTKQF